MSCSVFAHASDAALEWVVRAEPTRENPQPELQVVDADPDHQPSQLSVRIKGHERRIEAQQGRGVGERLSLTHDAVGAAREFPPRGDLENRAGSPTAGGRRTSASFLRPQRVPTTHDGD